MNEEQRKALPPFNTKIAPFYEETLDQLKGWREPNHAYILLETNERKLVGGNVILGHGLMTLNVQNRPQLGSKLRYYVISKRYRILHYAKFPTANDAIPANRKQVQLHSGYDGRNPWEELANEVQQMMNINPNWKQEKSALEEKLAALELKLKKANDGDKEQPEAKATKRV